MKVIWHHNSWPWGKTITIITANGGACVDLSFEDNNPGVCFISGLSVINPLRRKGLAKQLMLDSESYCREHGIFRIDLNSVMTDWVIDFYKKCGYSTIKEQDGYMQMYKILTK